MAPQACLTRSGASAGAGALSSLLLPRTKRLVAWLCGVMASPPAPRLSQLSPGPLPCSLPGLLPPV